MAETNAKVNGFEAEFVFAVDLVKRTGKVIKEAFSREKVVREKSSAADLVTETDQLVEGLLVEALAAK